MEDRPIEAIKPNEKRFSIQKEGWAIERVKGIKQAYNEIHKDHPEILSFCGFGSLMKGKSRPDTDSDPSDIDLFVYIEANTTQSKFDGPITERKEMGGLGCSTVNFTEEIKNKYTNAVREALKKAAHVSDTQTKDIFVLPVNNQIIDQQVTELTSALKIQQEYDRKVKNHKPGESFPKFPGGVFMLGYNLSSMFHLDIGGGIKPYRNYLIDKLQGLGEVGEELWKKIIVNIEGLERNYQTGTSIRYPRTLDEAKKLYSKN